MLQRKATEGFAVAFLPYPRLSRGRPLGRPPRENGPGPRRKDKPVRYRPICKNKEFSRVYARGKSYVAPQLVLYVLKNRLGHTRVGLTATKKIGGAVVRNRARRVMRAAIAECLPYNAGSYDLVFVARGITPRLKSTKLKKTVGRLLAQAGLPQIEGPGPASGKPS